MKHFNIVLKKASFLKLADLPLAHLKVKGAITSQNALLKVCVVSLLSETAWGGGGVPVILIWWLHRYFCTY